MKVAVDIGHCSKGDVGAVSACKLSEHAFWAAHFDVIRDELVRYGYEVKRFRREDYGGITGECRAINAWRPDVVVSLHLNSSDNKTAGGHEVIHFPGSKRGVELAKAINDQLGMVEELKDRGVKEPFAGRGLPFLRGCAAPAVIVEAAFLSNAGDVAVLRGMGDVVARCVANGVYAFFQT